ncbi:hypothetical protein SAMN00808754_2712 [Thermanaeromonas toyohensis ToBE]|uniref:Uncharacterized protein n=1 Tax=Thermanaeromonas toyohensis ToBE TaxID=698762 RepID=A0A1W1W1T1_9FIRM|nr:hypothetical protein [Thermanaeromonas toyohensis]SMB99054.1 hypothetical protein SAMN00808754_2712 [Thermanaeromonas toyohensis ToBE]
MQAQYLELILWQGDNPPLPVVPFPPAIRRLLARRLGIPEDHWQRVHVLAQTCAYCGRGLEDGRIGSGMGIYDKPSGGKRLVLYALCYRCSLKAANSASFRERVVQHIEIKAITAGFLPWLDKPKST